MFTLDSMGNRTTNQGPEVIDLSREEFYEVGRRMKAAERDEMLIRIDQSTKDESKYNRAEHKTILTLLELQNGRVRKNTILIVALWVAVFGGGYSVFQWLA